MVQEGKQQVATLPYEAQRGRGRVESPIKYQFFFPRGYVLDGLFGLIGNFIKLNL